MTTKQPSDSTSIRIQKSTHAALKKRAHSQGQTFDEFISNKFLQQEGKIGPLIRNSGKTQGTIYISSATGNIYTAPQITVQKIREMLQTPYIRSKLEKRILTFFPGQLIIEVLDPQQKVNKEETDKMVTRCRSPEFMLNEKVIQAYFDAFCYGEGHFAPKWARSRVRNEIYIAELWHYPAWSFDTAPYTKWTYSSFSDLLQGVILNDNGEPEYWQRQNPPNTEPIQITNIMIVKDPKDEDLAGFSKLIPLSSTIEMHKFVMNTEMQVINRAGAPIFFIKVENPQDANEYNGWVSDVDFANMIIKNASKDNTFQLRGNMTPIPVPFDPKKDNLATEAVLKKIIDDYFNISEMIQKDGATIGDTSSSALDITNQAALGVHQWILPQFENLLNQYFVLNGYPEGWSVHLYYELPDTVSIDKKLEQAKLLLEYRLGTGDDILKLLPNVDPKDEKGWQEVFDFWKKWDENQSKTQQPVQLPAQDEVIKKVMDNEDVEVEEDEEDSDKFKQMRPHTHLEEGEGEPLNPLAKDMLEEFEAEIDELAGRITKAVMKEVAA